MIQRRLPRYLFYWFGACLLLVSAGVVSFFLVRQIAGDEPDAKADLGPFWYSPALEEDSAKPRIARQTLNGILIGPESDLAPAIELCEREPGGTARPIPTEEVDTKSAGMPVEVSPSYLPKAVSLELAEARECSSTIVNVVKNYNVETIEDPKGGFAPLWSGGTFFIARTLTTEKQYPLQGAADRLRADTIAGHPAVVVEPVKPLGRDIGLAEMIIVVADGSTVTVIQGRGMPSAEFVKVAESLYKD